MTKQSKKQERTTPSQGVVILAFGNPSYAYAAWNLVASIRHFNNTIPIALAHDGNVLKYLPPLDVQLIEIGKDITHECGKFEPGKVKVHMYDISPFDETLYIDADSIVLKDIQPLIDELSARDGYYYTSVVDKGGKDADLRYNAWATMENIWQYFALPDDATLPTIQSSYCFFKKSTDARKFWDSVKQKFAIPYRHLKYLWGGTIPDELIFSGVCASFGIIPDGVDAVFFGNKQSHETYDTIASKYYIHTLYGSGRGQKTVRLKYIEWYDRLMKQYAGDNCYKAMYIMRGKHVDRH